MIERSSIENHLSTMPPVSSSESMTLAGIPKALHGLDKESTKGLAWQLKGEESTRRKNRMDQVERACVPRIHGLKASVVAKRAMYRQP